MAMSRTWLLLCVVASCKSEPPPKPWCEWAPQREAGLSIAVHMVNDSWGAPYSPHHVSIVATRQGDDGPELDTRIANDGLNLDDHNVQLARLRGGELQLRLSGLKQQPACYRLVRSELAWRGAPCSTDLAEPYSYVSSNRP
jgi:hypothetical protein